MENNFAEVKLLENFAQEMDRLNSIANRLGTLVERYKDYKYNRDDVANWTKDKETVKTTIQAGVATGEFDVPPSEILAKYDSEIKKIEAEYEIKKTEFKAFLLEFGNSIPNSVEPVESSIE